MLRQIKNCYNWAKKHPYITAVGLFTAGGLGFYTYEHLTPEYQTQADFLREYKEAVEDYNQFVTQLNQLSDSLQESWKTLDEIIEKVSKI